MIKCGFCETDITPALGMQIPGYFSERLADGILERLYACAVYFENGDGEKVVMVSTDSIIVPNGAVDHMRESIAERLSLPESSVMICATHAHTAGPVDTLGEFYVPNEMYVNFYASRVIDAAFLAAKDAREVTLRFAVEQENTVAHYRTMVNVMGGKRTLAPDEEIRPYGTIDPDVSVLRVDNADGTPYGAIINYSCHCDSVGGTKISADYPGEVRETMRKIYGADFHPLFINGFCGNIAHRDPRKAQSGKVPGYYKVMGRRVAAVAAHAFETGAPMENHTVAGADTRLIMPTREPTDEQRAWAEKTIQAGTASETDLFLAGEIRRFDEVGVRYLPVILQVLRVGALFLYCLPGEIFVEFGKMLKQRSPGKYNIMANLANGSVGYIPIKELFYDHVYEARPCTHNSQMEKTAGYEMVDMLLALAETVL